MRNHSRTIRELFFDVLRDDQRAAIGDAVRHALTHVEAVSRDGERLRKRTGCCLPTPGDVAGVSCCAPTVQAGR